jgi:hypothetical protein
MHSALHVQVVGDWCVLSCLAGHKTRLQMTVQSTHTTYTASWLVCIAVCMSEPCGKSKAVA